MTNSSDAALDERFLVAAARRMLYRGGCDSLIAGQVSIRASAGGFWITPFEYFDQTVVESVVRLDYDLEMVEGTCATSPAAAFHAHIFEHRPDIGALVHIHSPSVSVLVASDQTIGAYNVAATLFHDEQAHYVDDGIQPAVDGERMLEALGDRSVLLMRHHGALIAAPTVEAATVLAIVLEQSATYHLAARAIGAPEMPEAEVRRVKGQYHRYFLPQMWDASLRRLRRSDPDLFEVPPPIEANDDGS